MPTAVLDKKQGTYVIPAQHTDRLRAILSGEQPAPVPMDRVVQQVFSADYRKVYDIRAPLIVKLSNSDKATRLVLCSNFDGVDAKSCPLGDRCKFVHADVRSIAPNVVHTNYAWSCLEEVTYERFAPGKTLKVAAPSSKSVTDVIESDAALKTKALTSTRRPLSHCAHYYFNRTCNLGSECQFIHAVHIDPNAKPHQRAPGPVASGGVRALPESPSCDAADECESHRCVTPAAESRSSAAAMRRGSSSISYSTPIMESGSDSELYAGVDDMDPLAAAMHHYHHGRRGSPDTRGSFAAPSCLSPSVLGCDAPYPQSMLMSPGISGCSLDAPVSIYTGYSSRGTPMYRHNPYGLSSMTPDPQYIACC